ncbi:MAG: 50S ribosomal protein L17 [bacterium]
MRHRVKGNHLGRTYSHRLALLKSLTTALLLHKKIKTTVAKAKEARTFIEPLITKAKVDSVANRRFIARFVNDKEAVKELFGDIREKILDRKGGYLRIIKLGFRRGDAAEVAILEFVDYNTGTAAKEPKKEAVDTKKSTVKVDNAKVQDATVIEETVNKPVVEKVETIEDTKENN